MFPLIAGPVRSYSLLSAFSLVIALLTPLFVEAQAKDAAYGGGQTVWVGGEFSNLAVGFPYGSDLRMSGFGAFASFNWNHAFAVQAESNFLMLNSFHNETQKSFLAGPRYTFLHNGKWNPYLQFSIGDVNTRYPFALGSGNSFAIAPAGGLDYRFRPRWALHVQYGYQFLTNSPNFTDEPHFGIRPSGVQVGVSYRLHRWGQ